MLSMLGVGTPRTLPYAPTSPQPRLSGKIRTMLGRCCAPADVAANSRRLIVILFIVALFVDALGGLFVVPGLGRAHRLTARGLRLHARQRQPPLELGGSAGRARGRL